MSERAEAKTHVITLELPEAAYRAIEQRMGTDGRSTAVDVARELILKALFPLPEEYGEPTEEERRYYHQMALDREDLWGSEADKVWDAWTPSSPATS